MASYDDIVAQCKRTRTLYEDPDFPANNSSLFKTRDPPRPFEWKRPKEIVTSAKYVADGASRMDIQQGFLGNDWLLAAFSSLACNPSLWNRVAHSDGDFDTDYYGVFKFSIWRYGEWKEVVVDDRLPTNHGKLVFVHSENQREFWSALLEKAFAKLVGSYEALKGGRASDAMVDLTGGLTESYELDKAPANLLTIMLAASQSSAMMICSIHAEPNEVQARANHGLIKGHSYTITSVKKITLSTRSGETQENMVRVRNPWGNSREWTGAWSDKSNEWEMVAESQKRDIDLAFEYDGEFWMSYKDWLSNFDYIEICNLGPQSRAERGPTLNMTQFQAKDEWKIGTSAGGCRNFLRSFAANPQFRFSLIDSELDKDDTGFVVVSLMQMERRKMKTESGIQSLMIGFAIYKLEDQHEIKSSAPLDIAFFQHHASSARSPEFTNSREVVGRYQLTPGEYVVVPSTFNPGEEGKFMIRIFSEKSVDPRRADQPSRFSPSPRREPSDADRRMDDKFYQMFKKVAGVDREIDDQELQGILNAAFKKDLGGSQISEDTCRSLIGLYDTPDANPGKLGYSAFQEVFQDTRVWRNAFENFDVNKDDTMDIYELRSALKKIGFHISNDVLRALSDRFNNDAGRLGVHGFFRCVIRLRGIFDKLELLKETYKQWSPDYILTKCITF